jgi:hypothetical protein
MSGYTVLVRTLVATYGRFLNLFIHSVGPLWTNDEPIARTSTYTDKDLARTSTYTGQNNTERRGNTPMP